MTKSNIVLFCLILLLHIVDIRATCELNTTAHINKRSPLLLNGSSFIYPLRQHRDIVRFHRNQMQNFFCPHGSFELQGTRIQDSHLTLTCQEGLIFTFNNDSMHHINEIRCPNALFSTTRISGRCPNGQLIEIGFQLTSEKFASSIQLCFDGQAGKTTWAHTLIPGSIKSRGKGLKRPKFKSERHWENIPVAQAYKRKNQVKQFMKIFDDNQTLAEYYIKNKGEYFLSRGHLIAKSDKFYNIEQESTFHYVNTLPMWQIINSGNWASVEETVRALASDNGDVHVWVGGLYNLSLPDASNENKLVYLASHRVTNLPVLVPPKFLFKLVYHEPTNRAMVYITINNPYLSFSHLPNEYQICKEYKECRVSGKKFKNIKLGYTYCCTYDDFMKNQLASELGLPELHSTSPFV